MEQESHKRQRPEDDDLEIELTDRAAGPGGAAPSVHIDCDTVVRKQIHDYALTDTSRELGGVLIGTVRASGQPLVQVTAMIPARYTDARNASVTFTHETWQDILAIKDREYPQQKIVGWFHTHPGFGIFLSRFDLHIHENFFNLEWQIAYVVDPLAHTEGFFCWAQGQVQKTKDFTISGEVPEDDNAIPAPIPSAPPQALPATPLPTMIHTAPPALDWRYIAIAGLLAGVGYLLFFRPAKTVILQAPKVTIPRQEYVNIPPPPPSVPAPVALPAVTANPVEGWPVYTVQPQDTLWSISEKCYGDGACYPLLITANKLGSKRITTGMKLRVPGGKIPPAAQ